MPTENAEKAWLEDVAEKTAFVEGPLDDLLHAINPHILAANYRVRGNRREFVEVVYPSIHVKKINVTGDSLKAIVEDVMAAI